MAKKSTAKKKVKKPKPLSRGPEHDDSLAVTAFIRSLEGPLAPVVETVRRAILKADATGGITEGIKWNCASFHCEGWFAAVNLHAKHGLLVVLHEGAKKRAGRGVRAAIEDPDALLTWLGKDRAMVAFASAADFKAKARAFGGVVKEWVAWQRMVAGVG